MSKKIKYYSKRLFRFILIIVFPIMCISFITIYKYKPVYSVKFRGENIGLVGSKDELDSKIESLVDSPQAPIKEAKLDEKPEYSLKLANRDKIKTEENEVLGNIQDSIDKKYEIYEIKVNGKKISSVANKKEAKDLVDSLKSELSYNNITYNKVDKDKIEKDEISEEKDIRLAIKTEVDGIKKEEARKEEERRILLARQIAERNNAERRYSQLLSASMGSGNIENVRGLNILHPLQTSAYKISSPFGWRWGAFHTGVDFGTFSSTPPVYAVAPGKVIFAGWNRYGYGNLVRIDHGNGVETYYAHLSRVTVSPGQAVSKGQMIGNVGTTGYSTGPHLHFEIRINKSPINAVPFLPYY